MSPSPVTRQPVTRLLAPSSDPFSGVARSPLPHTKERALTFGWQVRFSPLLHPPSRRPRPPLSRRLALPPPSPTHRGPAPGPRQHASLPPGKGVIENNVSNAQRSTTYPQYTQGGCSYRRADSVRGGQDRRMSMYEGTLGPISVFRISSPLLSSPFHLLPLPPHPPPTRAPPPPPPPHPPPPHRRPGGNGVLDLAQSSSPCVATCSREPTCSFSEGPLHLVVCAAVLLGAATCAARDADPYKQLDVGRGASDSEIKKGYRKLSLKYHPDKQQGKSADDVERAQNRFMKIQKAYETLSDGEKKRNYDSTGYADPRDAYKDQPPRGPGGHRRPGRGALSPPVSLLSPLSSLLSPLSSLLSPLSYLLSPIFSLLSPLSSPLSSALSSFLPPLSSHPSRLSSLLSPPPSSAQYLNTRSSSSSSTSSSSSSSASSSSSSS